MAPFLPLFLLSLSPDKHSLRFDRMISSLSLPSETIECIDSSDYRTLFRGISAAVSEPQIQDAFRIVYRDLAPVRVAGDLIFNRLSSAAELARKTEEFLVDSVDLEASRHAFDLVDGDGNGRIDREELLGAPRLLELVREEGEGDEEAADRFLELADENGDGVVSFVEFANAVADRPGLRVADEALATVLEEVKTRGVFGRKSPAERFDGMLEQCLQWEEDLGCVPLAEDECMVDAKLLLKPNNHVEEEEGRLLKVLKGALVGARCEPVVDALKMVYLDYSPLRLGGDIIFSLLKRIVKTQLPQSKLEP